MLEKSFSIDIRAPLQRVWEEVTRRGVRCDAMFGTYLHGELRPGAMMSYRSKDGKHTFVAGEILEVEAPTRLVHTFWFTMEQDEPTLVEWALTEASGGTRVTVTHSRFRGETRTYRSVSTSWPRILGLFRDILERGGVGFGVRARNAMMASMSFMLPARALTRNVTARPLPTP